MLPDLNREEFLRYSRHLMIPEVGLEGQRKLKGSSVLVIGTGGLGSPVSLYLAAAGIGHLGIVDYDEVDGSNLQRQIVHGTSTVGKAKVESAQARLTDLNPLIDIEPFHEPFLSENAYRIAKNFDVIIDGTDNFSTRYLANDFCVLTGKPFIYGAVFRFEGQVSVFDARSGPCYRCLFPEPPPPDVAPSCAEAGVFGVLPGTIGTIQATEAIKLILGIGTSLSGRLLLYNALDMSFDFVTLRKNPRCSICGPDPEITHLVDYLEFCDVPGIDHKEDGLGDDYEITPMQLKQKLDKAEPIFLVDVRQPHELTFSKIEPAVNIPLNELPKRIPGMDKSQEIIVFCKAGSRSSRAVKLLLDNGFLHIKNLRGGINAWAMEVDKSLPIY